MPRTTMTLEELISKTPDGELYDIFCELDSGVVPATGYSREFCRKVNRMIDRGHLCINPTTYRKVYLPTLAKVLYREMSRRYAECVRYGKL